jgi:hypothetical protein
MPADRVSIRPAIPQDRAFLISLNARLVVMPGRPRRRTFVRWGRASTSFFSL